jgi:hypothetical protein
MRGSSQHFQLISSKQNSSFCAISIDFSLSFIRKFHNDSDWEHYIYGWQTFAREKEINVPKHSIYPNDKWEMTKETLQTFELFSFSLCVFFVCFVMISLIVVVSFHAILFDHRGKCLVALLCVLPGIWAAAILDDAGTCTPRSETFIRWWFLSLPCSRAVIKISIYLYTERNGNECCALPMLLLHCLPMIYHSGSLFVVVVVVAAATDEIFAICKFRFWGF